ncbi:MAG: ferredoxin family protein [Geobacter sp.]|nr:ferredoxin family protein [Geobacter sp.]
MNIDEIFDFTSFTIDREPHIVLKPEVCSGCDVRGCVNCCPARCYTWSEAEQKMTFVHDGCLECGTCYVVCQRNAFSRWQYPRGGFGVAYRMT